MRITGGRLGGRLLVAPEGMDVRPTSEKLRQAIFNILAHRAEGPPLEGARVLDLFAGTGAMGIEALSRGAAYCVFIEEAPGARAAIRCNVETLNLTGVSKIWRRDACDLGVRIGAPFDLAFLDPPYRCNLAARALTSLVQGQWLAPDARVVIETAEDEPPAQAPRFVTVDERVYGGTRLTILKPCL